MAFLKFFIFTDPLIQGLLCAGRLCLSLAASAYLEQVIIPKLKFLHMYSETFKIH